MANLNTSSISALDGYIQSDSLENFGTAGITISGTWIGTLTFYGSQDGTLFVPILAQNISTNKLTSTTTASGQFLVGVAGLKALKVQMTSYTSGTASVVVQATNNTRFVRALSTLLDSSGAEVGTTGNPVVTSTTLSFAPELLNGRLFSASIEVNAALSGSDNPLVLFRNPLDSGKNYFIFKIVVGISTTNVAAVFKLFGSPVHVNTAATITNITQPGSSTTVTVTTSTAHNATVGATVVISGTTDFNGTHAVASVTSANVYTFVRAAPPSTLTNTSGTSTINSSLGTVMSEYPMKRVAVPAVPTGIATSLPTVSSLGNQLVAIAQGQNTTPPLLVDSAQVSMEPGQGILVTANPNSNNRSTTVTIIWSEVPQ